MKYRSLILSFVLAASVLYAVHGLKFRGSVPYFLEVTNGVHLLDVKPAFGSDRIYERFEEYGDEGRAEYRFRLFTIDLLLPLSVLWFFLLAMAKTSALVFENKKVQYGLVAIPIIYVAFDIVENTVLFYLLSEFPTRVDSLAGILPYVTLIKRVASMGSLFLPIIMLITGKLLRHRKLG